MQSKKLKKLIAIFFVLAVLSSCTRDLIVPEPPAPPTAPIPPGPPDTTEYKISYSGEIQPIFTQHCISCHGDGGKNPVLVSGKSYHALMTMPGMVDTIVPGNSILYLKMSSGTMKPFCTKANSDSTYKWIRQGAKNN